MGNWIAQRNELLGKSVIKNLAKRNMEGYYCATKEETLAKALELIPETDVVAWGGSVTIDEIGLLAAVKARNPVIDRDTAATMEEKVELMRKGLTCDTFLMSTNAMSEDGILVNIDGNGNRVASLIFGPKQVVIIAGVNKIAKDLDSAIARVRSNAAPINAQRFAGISTPCAKTGVCSNCNAPDCMCCQVVVTRHSRQAGRIKIILVGENLGF
ncbi:MAG: lactate utilization protein [Phascolarctobacterium sp.]|nr:lactate utilization protein [Phascolarctobacterium sp.]